jgi:hypothetical protein
MGAATTAAAYNGRPPHDISATRGAIGTHLWLLVVTYLLGRMYHIKTRVMLRGRLLLRAEVLGCCCVWRQSGDLTMSFSLPWNSAGERLSEC